jgi:hypothetical protein
MLIEAVNYSIIFTSASASQVFLLPEARDFISGWLVPA